MNGPGHDALWGYFGLSYASWLTMPRVLMHEMPDDWQARMAVLCQEWDAHWDFSGCGLGTPTVLQRTNRKFAKWPRFVLEYRHPDREAIQCFLRNASPKSPR